MEIKTVDIEIQITIHASAQRVFAALTTGVAVWWGVSYVENEQATKSLVIEPKIGGRFYERWALSGDEEGSLLGTVTAIKRGELLRLEGSFGMTTAGVIHNKISFVLEPLKSETLLKFSHQARGSIDDEWELKYGREWRDLLGRLKLLIEKGKADGIIHDPSLDAV